MKRTIKGMKLYDIYQKKKLERFTDVPPEDSSGSEHENRLKRIQAFKDSKITPPTPVSRVKKVLLGLGWVTGCLVLIIALGIAGVVGTFIALVLLGVDPIR